MVGRDSTSRPVERKLLPMFFAQSTSSVRDD
eukprot:CAMPEP_0185516896 /NCGR_PEP_ID=MMETSP1366-20130426/66967_1 /TAXON_ID=38817 /ORGANISM="Gephyrocapsa oceanica, Strain RCC1303" /LENGTH=30 /DNA_ID= /DNA_START= /DNA_END= /DNA_ORIENTATION=